MSAYHVQILLWFLCVKYTNCVQVGSSGLVQSGIFVAVFLAMDWISALPYFYSRNWPGYECAWYRLYRACHIKTEISQPDTCYPSISGMIQSFNRFWCEKWQVQSTNRSIRNVWFAITGHEIYLGIYGQYMWIHIKSKLAFAIFKM